jgi:hypothetical protein
MKLLSFIYEGCQKQEAKNEGRNRAGMRRREEKERGEKLEKLPI